MILLYVMVPVGAVCLAFAVRRVWLDARGRGEVAEAPEVEDIRPCPVNATPHRCDYARSLPEVPFGTGESLARELTDYLRGNR